MTACAVGVCDRQTRSGTLCTGHAERRRRGVPLDVQLRPRRTFDADDRESVRQRLLMQRTVEGDCWLWTGATSRAGYGQVGNRGRVLYVHQLAAFAWEVGGSGPYVLHRCDRPTCFAPAHLYRGTPRDNVRDMWDRGRAWQQLVGSA